MNISQSCIVNYFGKAGMSDHYASDKIDTVNASIDISGLDRQTFDNWMQVDDDLPGDCVLTESEVIESVFNSVKPKENERRRER